MLLLQSSLFLLNFASVHCCNVYSDFCDTMDMDTMDTMDTMDDMDMDTMETNIDLRHKRATEGSANLSRHEMADWVTGVLDGLFTEERYNKQFRPGQPHF